MRNFNRDNRSEPRNDFSRRNFGKRSFDEHGGRREMHKAVCSNCGKDCEVPFRPTGDKPVYCSECFGKNSGGPGSGRFRDTNPRRPDFERKNDSGPQSNELLVSINRKLEKIIEILTVTPVIEESETKPKPEEVAALGQKKKKSSKKTTAVSK